MSDRRRGAALAVNTPLETPSAGNSNRDRQIAALRPAWQPGKSGNPRGRPKGSRNKIGEEFFDALYQSFQIHGREAIRRVAVHHPVEFIKIIVSILPKHDPKPRDPFEDMSDDELEDSLSMVRRMIAAEKLLVDSSEQ